MQNNPLDSFSEIAAVIEPISQGMALDKCRKCGCMQLALDAARQAVATHQSDEAKQLLRMIAEYKNRWSR